MFADPLLEQKVLPDRQVCELVDRYYGGFKQTDGYKALKESIRCASVVCLFLLLLLISYAFLALYESTSVSPQPQENKPPTSCRNAR